MLFPLSRKETSLPEEIQQMDLDSIEMYFKALKEGKEHVRDIRYTLDPKIHFRSIGLLVTKA